MRFVSERSGVVITLVAALVVGGMGTLVRTFWLPGSLGLAAAVAALAFVAYWDRRDPAVALIGVGAASFAISLLILTLVASSLEGIAKTNFEAWQGDGDLAYDGWYSAIVRSASVAAFGGIPGLGGLAACLAFVVPWRDRRGRRPLDPRRVALAVGVPVAVASLWLLIARPSPPGHEMAALLELPGPGPILRLGIALVIALGCVATARTWVAGARHAWTCGAALAVTLAAIALLVVSFGDGSRTRLDVGSSIATSLPAVAFALLLVGFLSNVQLETSRMRRASDRAEEVLGGRAEIASMLAHEVRGPVATIKGLAATTGGSYEKLSDDERREFVGLIEEEASRLLDVVDQTSLALKIDARTLTIEGRPQDLATVVRDAVDKAAVGDHPVATALVEELTVTVDRRWLAVAFRQGIENAARFSPPGAPIEVSTRAEGGLAVIEIADRGPGIPPERAVEVFSRFARWRPPGYEDRQGSGLGLFICRGILAEHAGDASLDARPEGGTMLRLTIPLTEPPPMEG